MPEPPTKASIPVQSEHNKQTMPLDTSILAYIDHSLKNLIGPSLQHNNYLSQLIQSQSAMPMVFHLHTIAFITVEL